ncbi:hypothetical protein H6G89_01275 [Oscillatoria sp. FACHB-1407]|uniref:hypothetical protein n=1 Tax=Oscillatoria sp. FACHB-1407 TaxID=2692847 RepID=UPI001685B5A9|nr:hypothetical protein [Oscillatoria sp. FACHB-1407]MBD2459661.1 hypothetical protein [Oscillatoria sp. FACHB-1407]
MPLNYFVGLIVATGCVALTALWVAYRQSRDTLHPLVYLGLMLFYLYSYLPFSLVQEDANFLQTFLSASQLEYIQTINLIGVISICLGVLFGSKKTRFNPLLQHNWSLSPVVRKRLKQGAIVCGFLGIIGFAYGIVRQGGLSIAYGRAYGGGWSESGYIREAILLTLPALLWLMVSQLQQKLTSKDWILIAVFATPLLMHGFLGARRGPTAMILTAAVVGWYFVRFKRPPLLQVFGGAIALGMLMLFLVSNRGNIYLGSDFQFGNTSSYATEISSANEFIYGGGVILNTDATDAYLWGRRYFTIFFIRPIPRFLWPTKYEDASAILGIPNLELNLGTGGETFENTLGWSGAVGSAPGLIADMWLEFCWISFPVLFGIGWVYGMAWRKALTRGGLWIAVYTLMSALSVYLVMQTLEAMAFRFLFMTGATWLIWRYSGGRRSSQASLPSSNYPVYDSLIPPPSRR